MIKTLNGDITQIFANDGSEIIMVKDYLGRTVFEKVKPTTITGTLPLTVLANGKALKNYQIYGTAEGAGVETENLFSGKGKIQNIGAASIKQFVESNMQISPGEIYCINASSALYSHLAFYMNNIRVSTTRWISAQSSITIPDSCNNMYVEVRNYNYDVVTDEQLSTATEIMLVKGSTAPSSYIPHGYKLPLTVTADGATTDYPVYIGDSQLMEGEYVDYREQKMYKYAEPLKIYGWHVDPSISDPSQAITYLEDAVGKTPAAMGTETFSYGSWADAFFMPKPCMVKSDGTVDYYLDPNDYTKKADGTASDVDNASFDGNAMMEWPLIWWKYEAGETEGEGYFYVSNRKVDDSFNCWCNYNCDDKIVSHFYTAIYNGTGTSKMRSISGVVLTRANGNGGTTATQEITRATANNTTDKTEWYTDVWSDRMLINGLLILMGKSLNSQAAFGRGLDTGSQAAEEAYVTGSLNDKGLFWGDTAAGSSAVKVFGMENWWGCVWHRTAGLIGLSDGKTAYKLTYGTADGTTADGYNTNGNGYLIDTTVRPTSGYFKTAKFGKFGYLPLTVGSSSATYFTDYWYTNNSILTFALVGGSANSGVYDGCSFFDLSVAAGIATWNVSSSLSFKPLAKTVPKPDLIPTDPPVPFPEIALPNGEATLDIEGDVKPQAELTGYIQEVPPKIYGWHVDPSISDPANAITYLGDAVGKTPAIMGMTAFSYGDWEDAFFMPKPCMLRYDGTVAYYLDPNDYTKKADGTASDVADPNFEGNAMMEWPLIWYKFEAGEADGEGYFYCANQQVDSSYKCWCNYDSHNNIIPHFYTAIYDFTIQNGKARSLSGIALTSANGSGNTSIQTEANAVLACNTSPDVEWYFGTWSDRVLVAALLILMSKSLNDSAVFGKGTSIGSSYISGTLNNKGLFWGNTSDGALGVKIFGMENWWGSKFKRIAGLIGAGYGKSYMYKLTYGNADGSAAAGYNMTGSGYLTAFDQPNVYYDYVTKMGFGKHGMLPSAVGGSDSTYYAEYYDSGNRGDGCALFGGTGALYLYMGGPNGDSDWESVNYTGTLSCKPVLQVSATLNRTEAMSNDIQELEDTEPYFESESAQEQA